MIVRESAIHVGKDKVVTVGDSSRFEPSVFYLCLDELDNDSSAFEMWLVVQLLNNSPRHLAHTGSTPSTYLKLRPFRTGVDSPEDAHRLRKGRRA